MRLRVNLKKSSLSDALLANVSEQGKPIKRLLNAKRSQTPKLRRRSQYEQEVASKGGLAVVHGEGQREFLASSRWRSSSCLQVAGNVKAR